MSTRASFSVARAWSEALGFLPRAWGGAWLILLMLWLAVAAAPHAMLPQIGHLRLVHIAVTLVGGLLKFMALGALYRLALFGGDARREGLGLGGLQFSVPELRLLGANIVIGLFFLLIATTLIIVFAIASHVAGIDPGDFHMAVLWGGAASVARPSAWLVAGYALASLFILVFLAIKFTLAHAATVAERRMVTLNALGLSSGNAGKLFIGLAVLAAPFLLAGTAAFHYLHPRFVLSPRPPAFDPGFHLYMVVRAVLMAATILVLLPLSAGFLSSAYRQIVKNRSN